MVVPRRMPITSLLTIASRTACLLATASFSIMRASRPDFCLKKNYSGPQPACVTAEAASCKFRRETRLELCENYVKAMWLMLQAEEADDFVIAPEKRSPLENFSMKRSGHLDHDWQESVDIDPRYYCLLKSTFYWAMHRRPGSCLVGSRKLISGNSFVCWWIMISV
jgi:hypothetical protein